MHVADAFAGPPKGGSHHAEGSSLLPGSDSPEVVPTEPLTPAGSSPASADAQLPSSFGSVAPISAAKKGSILMWQARKMLCWACALLCEGCISLQLLQTQAKMRRLAANGAC